MGGCCCVRHRARFLPPAAGQSSGTAGLPSDASLEARDRQSNARPWARAPSGFRLCSSKGAKRTMRSARDQSDQLLSRELSKSTLGIYHQLLLHAYPPVVDTG